jgi:hypothetical protein
MAIKLILVKQTVIIEAGIQIYQQHEQSYIIRFHVNSRDMVTQKIMCILNRSVLTDGSGI